MKDILKRLGLRDRQSEGKEKSDYVQERYGIDMLMMRRLADYLKSSGDQSAISFERVSDLPNQVPDFFSMYLRWDLSVLPERIGLAGTSWQSKGVMVQSSGVKDGKSLANVYFTGDEKDLAMHSNEAIRLKLKGEGQEGWIPLDKAPSYDGFKFKLDIQRSGSGDYMRKQDDITIEEKVRFAMTLASDRPDYRHGMGNATGVASELEISLLTLAV